MKRSGPPEFATRGLRGPGSSGQRRSGKRRKRLVSEDEIEYRIFVAVAGVAVATLICLVVALIARLP